jgi:pimeloyl-ACP methyl ester carboxylesterase
LTLFVGGCGGQSATLAACERSDRDWVAGGDQCLHIKTFRSPELSDQPRLIVAIHGDFDHADEQYLWAQKVADENQNVVVVGLLRPGYTDPEGRQSSGTRGMTTGDNYTPEAIDAIADAIGRLARMHNATQILIAGHSGGAAITADIMGRHPGLAAAAVVVSCPCDVARWREHMRNARAGVGALFWRLPVRSLSPHELATTVEPKAAIAIIVGERDDVAPPALSQDYRDRLRSRGVRVDYTELAGREHDIFLDGAVRAEVTRLLRETPGLSRADQSSVRPSPSHPH